ncbi:DEAD/DEAH box helicase [Fervidobacterium nodosum]|uniref:Transcription-repair-coupling factor n=1 Tax=Fervidobacterium nodosum (strain ATCC 35602 / DSM 5306 / Rt17-B1) TaxID=381764 RepID=A7HNV8_FERNB|nr:DEAD/DEAH box helicase domain protein [Fervidobacterium nodosum Rt17-B1]
MILLSNEILIVPSEKETNIEGYYYIPDYDVLPYENLRPSWYVRSRRIYALYLAVQGKLKGIATLRALLHYVMKPSEFKKYIYHLKPGDELSSPEELFAKLGYERVFNVREGGTFSIRGEIIDYLGPDNMPVRIELYGNLIEEIRRFDLKTQRSQEKLESALLLPAREFVVEEFKKIEKLEPIDEQLTGKYCDGTFLDYNVNFYIYNKKSVIEHFSSFERELRNSIQDIYQKDEYKKFGIISYEDILSKAQEIELKQPITQEKLLIEEEYIPSAPVLSEDELQVGDLVVHKRYGIARFTEIKKVETISGAKEFLVLNFADSTLYVPIERIDLIDKYIGDDVNVKLDSLKKGTWSKKVSKAKRNIETIVRDMLLIHYIRNNTTGVALPGDSELESEFAKTFPYIETEDQLKAIQDVFEDLVSGKPMDRLLVGDAGYGKTEVAIRAIFRAIVSGKQAALLAPTTVLARQHYENIAERFKPFGIRVALLDRFVTKKEREEILRDVKNGKIDLLIGTHSILNNVVFADLGLVVIDEEQKFGVEQKEKFKKLRVNVHVLSMSATPIPRTLHMALSELKEFSEIKTPPFGRKEVQVHIGPFDDRIVRIAILREINRGGQVIYVHNRVNTIYDVYERLKELLPEVSIVIGHGQQSKSELKRAIDMFFHGKADVLLCTTIVENGVDVPNANTLIVDDAHRYGLAQLYQLRGRVGRSDKISFAYFFHPKHVNDKVLERLYAIKSYVGPGSGLKIAMRDMEIRGIGAVFGLEQHGYINDIGLNYYLELLDETIKESKGELISKVDTELEGIPGSIIIPEAYIYDPFERMRFYRRIASATSIDELMDIKLELEDRFGKIPNSVENLLKYGMLRVLLWKMGVKKATIGDSTIVVEFKNGFFEKISERYIYNEKEDSYIFFCEVEEVLEKFSTVHAK